MKIAICDRDVYNVEKLIGILIKYNREFREIEIFTYVSGEELMYAYLKKGLRFDMVFLDVLLEKMNGIETARKILEIDSSVLFFFVTQSMDFALEGYEVRAFRYILKPFTEERIKKDFGCAVKELFKNDKRYAVQTKAKLVHINVEDLLYLESVKRQVFATTVHEKIAFYSKLQIEEERLKAFSFVRVHQGFLVNMAYISTIVEGNIILKNGSHIPISKSRKKSTLTSFTKYLTEYDFI